MFKKGSFEVGAPIYPVTIKYDPRFGDAFWNSQQQSWMEYILSMMTSWAIVADVWYLPRMERLVRSCELVRARAHRSRSQPNEDAIAFAARVKRVIAAAGGFLELDWDGELKRYKVSDKLRAKQ